MTRAELEAKLLDAFSARAFTKRAYNKAADKAEATPQQEEDRLARYAAYKVFWAACHKYNTARIALEGFLLRKA